MNAHLSPRQAAAVETYLRPYLASISLTLDQLVGHVDGEVVILLPRDKLPTVAQTSDIQVLGVTAALADVLVPMVAIHAVRDGS